MNSKERMYLSLEHKEPDRVPYQVFFVPEMYKLMTQKYINEINTIKADKDSNDKDNNITVQDLDVILGHDMLMLNHGMGSLSYYKNTESDIYLDDWGITWKKVWYKTINGKGYYTDIIKSPLADDSLIDSYIPPDPSIEEFSYDKKIIDKYGKDYFIFSTLGGIFEGVKYLRGITQGLIDIVINKDICNKIMDLLIDYHLKIGFNLIKLGVDMLYLADDYGSETSMLISPDSFKEVIKPKMAYMLKELKKKNKDIKIAFHSCGYIVPIIDDLIEIGVDILHPIQPEAMDPNYIKKRFGNRIVLWGSISQQRTMPFGNITDVENEVKERIEQCAPGAGFILAPAQSVQLDTPIENIEAFYSAVKKYGKYPVRI